jgi:hypothetical protein
MKGENIALWSKKLSEGGLHDARVTDRDNARPLLGDRQPEEYRSPGGFWLTLSLIFESE